MIHQLEIPLTRRNTTYYPCIAHQYPQNHRVIPGLDAELCRCLSCVERGGIWWVDANQRADCLDKRKHKHPYLKQVYGQADTPVDHDLETKETKAQAAKRKNPAWAGQKLGKNDNETDSTLWSQH
ncbi:MAG: hypothetical protein AAGA46_00150 [Cyanobacteria bacterium P01_F01_bin.13]